MAYDNNMVFLFFGALLSFLSVILLSISTYVQMVHMRRSIALTIEHNNRNLVNLWNVELIKTDERMELARKLREPIVGQPEDQLLFIYVNYLSSRWYTCKKGLEDKNRWELQKKHAANWFVTLEKDQLERLLNFGYSAEFKKEILLAVEVHKKEKREAALGTSKGGKGIMFWRH